jgi:stage II sporulation protein D
MIPFIKGDCAQPTHPGNIQVLLFKDISSALLEVRGPYYIFDPADGYKISSGLFGKRFDVHASDTGMKWGEEFVGIHQITVVPRSSNTSILLNGIEYRGAMSIYKIGSKISIINEIDIETYIKAILSPQFNYPLENEVLSAIAIAERTTAYFQVNTASKESFWHVEAKDVGYAGTSLIVQDSPVTQAVDTTKHMILVNPQDGKNLPFTALWTEHSAGKTAAFHSIFRIDHHAPKEGVEVPHSALDRENSKWTYSITKKNLADLLGMKKVDSIECFVDHLSGKTYGFRVKDGKEVHDYDFLQFQEKLGKDKLLSNDLKLSIRPTEFTINGAGKGHGVGICLHAASAMAQKGEMAIKILANFFPGTFLVNLDAVPEKVTK